MGVFRSLLGVVVVVVLTISLLAGNVVVGADRTVMNEEFVTGTLEEERAYTTIQSVAADEAETRVSELDDNIPVPVDPGRATNETLTRTYLKNQTETNIEIAFANLKDSSEELNFSIRLTPVKENVAGLAEERIRELTVAELIDVVIADRDLSVEVQGVTFDLRIVSNMSEGPGAYQAAREDFREDVRQIAINQLVESAYQSASNDELLTLIGEDPRQYNESEKERIVREREDEIKTELEDRIREESGDEIEQRVDEQLRNADEQVESLVSSTVNESVPEQYGPAAEPATDMLMVGVRGLTTNMTYDTFDSRLSNAKSDLADNVSVVVGSVLDEEFDDRFYLMQELDDEQRDSIRQAFDRGERLFGTVDLLTILLPVVSLGLIGLLYLITRSLVATAIGSGVSLLSAGGSVYAVATIAPGMIESQVESELTGSDVPREAVDLALGIVEQVLGAFAAQSLVLAVLGVVLIGGGLFLRFRGASDEIEPGVEPDA